ncbi:MAG: type II toxin-antitoxin system RelB/DinJ family antitoxin [Deferribacteraceae bacterium]|jgi:DNA-damage-inducible protein J|nr:type II toxin-antitoxin system RelB/DinJ family antitoxin [Deferribacteraceae bacterium]
MANTSMLHVRIDDNIKAEAAENLANIGLTVSDAVRMLLTRVAKEGGMPVELLCDTEAYDNWFRAKVQEALDDDSLIPHEQVVADLQKIIDSKRKKQEIRL